MDGELRRQTLGDLLHRSAKRFPNKTAIICGDTAWTYATFDAVCNRLATGLAARGIGKGTRVAILSRNSHAFAALRFALARLGAVLVPINFMLKAEEAAFILRHAGAEMLATDSGLADVARAASALDTKVRELVWLPSEEKTTPAPGMIAFDELLSNSAEPPQVGLSDNDLAQIVYTSGTESLPKGTMLTHNAVIWQYVSCEVHRSPHLMLGYFHDDERTKAAFEGGWFHSGDLATIDADGYIFVVDRKKDMIKTGGENVASREVEEMIYRLPQVSEVAVVGVPHARWVEAVVAVIVVKAGQSLSKDAIHAHCAEHLAAFKVPKDIVFAEALPRNPSGKLLKRELRHKHARLFGQ